MAPLRLLGRGPFLQKPKARRPRPNGEWWSTYFCVFDETCRWREKAECTCSISTASGTRQVVALEPLHRSAPVSTTTSDEGSFAARHKRQRGRARRDSGRDRPWSACPHRYCDRRHDGGRQVAGEAAAASAALLRSSSSAIVRVCLDCFRHARIARRQRRSPTRACLMARTVGRGAPACPARACRSCASASSRCTRPRASPSRPTAGPCPQTRRASSSRRSSRRCGVSWAATAAGWPRARFGR